MDTENLMAAIDQELDQETRKLAALTAEHASATEEQEEEEEVISQYQSFLS